MQWFFAYSGNAAGWFKEMIKVAVISSKKHTTLQANCLYDGPGDEVIDWLGQNGVSVHRASVPFREELFSDKVMSENEGTHYRPDNASGHFLRLLVPDYSDSDYSLYTDCDVMFSRDPNFHEVDIFGACAELDGNGAPANTSFNSGVMLINNENFSSERPALIDFLRASNFYHRDHSSYDQALLNIYFKDRWDLLPQELNWRPWQGLNDAAEIIHFHGPKPQRIPAIMKGDCLDQEMHLLKYINRDVAAYAEYVMQFQVHLSAAK